MIHHRKHSNESTKLPELSLNYSTITKSSIYTNNRNSLSRYETELRTRQKQRIPTNKLKNRATRLKTINVNDHQTCDNLRRQLRSVKQAINYKIKQYNHRLESRLDQCELLSSIKKQQPHVIYQPFPLYLPPMMSHTQHCPNYNGNFYPREMQKPKRSHASSKLSLLNFRKVGLAVLFTIRLKKFTNKVIKYRKQMFNKYLYEKNEFKEEANQIKNIMIDGLKPFLFTVLQKQDSELAISEGDSESFKKQKVLTTRRLVALLIQCIGKTVEDQSFASIIRSVYYFCRHGSYACLQKLLTNQQLQNISISEKHHYLQAEKNLQKAQIINFLFMKILIYNALGQCWKIDSQRFSKEKQILQLNVHLITSILYEILMDIQDDFIVNSPQSYPLNNYQRIKDPKIHPAQSLTVKPGQFRRNQMISGLINQNYIKSTYKLEKLWTRQKNQLIQIIGKIHSKVAGYHKRLIQPFL